jgi:hypothetical protein
MYHTHSKSNSYKTIIKNNEKRKMFPLIDSLALLTSVELHYLIMTVSLHDILNV